MTSQLAEQIRKSGIVNSPVGDPEKGVGFRIDPAHPITQRTDTQPISKAEATFRSVMMGLVATAPITDRQSLNQAEAILESGKAALHERAVSTFSATLEQAANTIPPEYMLEMVTKAVQTYEERLDPNWVNSPEETVRRAAEARGYNPADLDGGRSEIFRRDAEKLKLAMEEGKNISSFEILQTLIFHTLSIYERTDDGRIVAVWQDGEREYSSNQDAWEDVFTTQTLRNVMNETLATLAGSNMAVSDPAAPASGTEDPTTSPELDPTNPPTPTDELPPPSPTPDLSTPEPIPPEQDSIDISNEAHQVIIIDGTTFSDKYTYVNPTTMVPPDGKTMDGGRQVFLDNANTQRDVLKRQGLTPGITTVHVRPDELINTVVTFDPEGRVMYVPSITVNGKVFFSSSTSKAYFDVDIPEGTRAQYKAISLPADTDPATVTVRHRGEADIVELTDKFGNQWVWDFRKGEFISMIDRPATAEMRAALPDYVAAYARTADAEHAELFSSPEAVMDRFEERTGTGKDGTPFKALVDPETNTILFLKTQNQETGEWEWEGATIGSLFLINNLDSTYLLRGYNDKNIEVIDYDGVGISLTTELDAATVFGNFSDSNWEWILSNWEEVQIQINNGELPNLPYNWTRGDNAIREINSDFTNPQITGSQLLEYGVGNEAIRNFSKNNNLSEDQMLKLFEFIIRSRVINYPEITNWHVSDEIATGFVSELPENRFWSEATGLTPAELVIKVGEWVKKDNPNAKTMIVEDNIFDFSNPNARWTRDYFYNTFIKQVIAMNQSGVIDGVVGENNWWIYEPQKWDLIEKQITFLQSNGLEILGAETMIVMGDEPINHDPSVRRKLTQLDNPELAQADMYAEWLRLMLKLGINEVGFGSMGADDEAWTNDVGLPDANPQFLDDNLKPKLAYFAMLRVLSENLTNH